MYSSVNNNNLSHSKKLKLYFITEKYYVVNYYCYQFINHEISVSLKFGPNANLKCIHIYKYNIIAITPLSKYKINFFKFSGYNTIKIYFFIYI